MAETGELFAQAETSPSRPPASTAPDGREPLAARMRPQTIDEFIGQSHILAPGSLLRRLIESDRFSALLFFGPPGTGKTSLAKLLARHSDSRFLVLNAVEASVADLRKAVEEAELAWKASRKRTILLVDEIHRFNKSQQDALLPHVESGRLRLIGATTENPFYSVNSALVSRMQVFQLEPLKEEEIVRLLERALQDAARGLGNYKAEADPRALAHLARACDGDARQALNALEVAVLTTPEHQGIRKINLSTAEQSIQKKAVVYDASGDQHYDTISAFIKCIRGSEPDAAVYWLAKMIEAGEDPRFIARRLVISAAEDIGLADPQALPLAVACHHAVEFIGMPEGRILLAEATVYLATAPKSNASYMAINRALEDVREGRTLPVPRAMRDSSHSGSREKLGHGKGYEYAHDYPGAIAPHKMMPQVPRYYQPTDRGYEKTVQDHLEALEKRRAPRP
jgi:putative ATPase